MMTRVNGMRRSLSLRWSMISLTRFFLCYAVYGFSLLGQYILSMMDALAFFISDNVSCF